jgi:hypothetical protein
MTLQQQSDAIITLLDREPADLVATHGECRWCGDATEPGERFCDSYCRLAFWREREG